MNSVNVLQVVDRSKSSVPGAARDNPPGEDIPDPGKAPELIPCRRVDVHASQSGRCPLLVQSLPSSGLMEGAQGVVERRRAAGKLGIRGCIRELRQGRFVAQAEQLQSGPEQEKTDEDEEKPALIRGESQLLAPASQRALCAGNGRALSPGCSGVCRL